MGDAFDGTFEFLKIGLTEEARRQSVAQLIVTLATADHEADALMLRDSAVKILGGIAPH
jgi:hypothetical protein